jgi:hypothetical protein
MSASAPNPQLKTKEELGWYASSLLSKMIQRRKLQDECYTYSRTSEVLDYVCDKKLQALKESCFKAAEYVDPDELKDVHGLYMDYMNKRE